MNRILTLLVGLVVVVALTGSAIGGGEITPVTFSTNNTQLGSYTQAVHSVLSDEAWQGYVEGALFQLSAASAPTVSVSFVEEADHLDYERVLFTAAGMTGTNNFYLIRNAVVSEANASVSNEGDRNFVIGGKIRLKIYSANKTNINIKAWLYIADDK